MDNSMKERILCVANKVIAEKGLNRFTLEEVAKEAGVSKGGLLYHYPSKDALIKGLIEYHINDFEDRVIGRYEDQGNVSSADWFIRFVEEKFNQACMDSDTNTMAGVLAAVAMNQCLLQPMKEKSKEWIDRADKLRDPIMGIIICFACDGIAFSNLFGLDILPAETKVKVMEG
jgi:AcrR family transcriptional regulator